MELKYQRIIKIIEKFDLREVALHCLKDLSAKLYPDLALELGLKAADVDKFEADHPRNATIVLILIIQAWMDRSDDEYKPSWLFLKGALERIDQKNTISSTKSQPQFWRRHKNNNDDKSDSAIAPAVRRTRKEVGSRKRNK